MKNISSVWQGILSARQFFKQGCCFKIGNGLGINPWKDPWLHDFPNRIPTTSEGVDLNRWTRIIDLRKENGQGWNEYLMQYLSSYCICKFLEGRIDNWQGRNIQELFAQMVMTGFLSLFLHSHFF